MVCSVCYDWQFGKCCRRTNFLCLTPDPRRTRNSTVKKSYCQRSRRPKVGNKTSEGFFFSVADPDPTFHFDADPDPTFHFDADPVWIRIQHKMEYKGHKIKNVSPAFWDAMLRLTLKRQDYVKFLKQ
jgi:hypothetical protein